MADNVGGRVVAIADAESIRELVAAVMEVDVAPVAIPQPLSLTRIQASRKGIRTVLCLNDTLRLEVLSSEQRAFNPEGIASS
jgi:hypothetical protein